MDQVKANAVRRSGNADLDPRLAKRLLPTRFCERFKLNAPLNSPADPLTRFMAVSKHGYNGLSNAERNCSARLRSQLNFISNLENPWENLIHD
jgi:hypothetical protein